jgi:hypothetical protein
VGEKIAKLYTILYGTSNEDIEQAGFLRAKAAHVRDRMAGGGTGNWDDVQQILEESYAFLIKGIS